MKLSLNEFETAVRKAAVGAGLPWGLADELAAACVQVAAAGGEAAAEALWALEDDRLVREAPAALDAAASGEAARLAHHGHPALAHGYVRAAAAEYRLGFVADDDGAALLIRQAGEVGAARPPARVAVNADDWARIGALAHRTYVPSTAESRAKGAGAGLTDND